MADKPLVWLHGEIKTPPFSSEVRRLAGLLLRVIQGGSMLSMPHSKPMPTVGSRCHELRIQDAEARLNWRIIYRTDDDAIIIGDVFAKKTHKTPQAVIEACRRRFNLYDRTTK